VKRLAASFAIATRDNGHTSKDRRRVITTLVEEYRASMHQFAAMANIAVWYSQLDVDEAVRELQSSVPPAVRRRAEANLAKARTRDSLQALAKLTHFVDGEKRMISDPPLIQPVDEVFSGLERDQLLESLRGEIRSYCRMLQSDRRHLLEDCRLIDVARKVVGVGASAHELGSSCSSAATTATRSSCRPKRRSGRCSRVSATSPPSSQVIELRSCP